MRRSVDGRALIIGAIVAMICVAPACGQGGEDSATASKRPFPKANEDPGTFVQRVAKLIETTTSREDCAQLVLTLEQSRVRFPCPAGKRLRGSMADFDQVAAEAYGTGAVVDYRSGDSPDGAAIILIVAPDRRWGISQFGVATRPSVGTSDARARSGYDAAVARYLRAVRERDCAGFRRVAFAAYYAPRRTCSALLSEAASLRRLLRQNPRAKPTYEGGNATYGFYSLETRNPEPSNRTISVASGTVVDRSSPIVMAVSPSPTAAYQRAAQKELRLLRREGSGVAPSDSGND